jgi:hypothetical protein
MSTFQRSLLSLSHPASVAAIGLLLLNDHVLKAAWPSSQYAATVTGKLSDFAGVFFFPFLLAAAISAPVEWALARRRGANGSTECTLAPRLLWALGFTATAAWFAGMKTIPAVNEWTAALAGWVAGGPVVIVRDPTDLLALVMLWPAWRVGRPNPPAPLPNKEGGAFNRARGAGRGAYVVLGLAALATIATSPCLPPPRVVRVAEHGGVWYAALDWEAGYADFAASEDGGSSWEGVDEVPREVAARFEAAAAPVVCAPGEALRCYRVGVEKVEGSSDGGQIWVAAWEIPPGRRTYMERYVNQTLSCRGEEGMDFGPYDLAVFEGPAGATVLVAMGTQGAMVGTPDGHWERVEVLGASPVPFVGAALFIILWEIMLSLGAAILTLLGLTALAWGRLLARTPKARQSVTIGKWLAAGGIGLFVMALFTLGGLGEIGLAAMGVGALLVVGGMLVGWVGLAAEARQPGRAWGMAGLTLLAALIVGAAPIALFSAWMAGGIAAYGVAAFTSLGLAVVAVSGGAWAIGRLGTWPRGGGAGAP